MFVIVILFIVMIRSMTDDIVFIPMVLSILNPCGSPVLFVMIHGSYSDGPFNMVLFFLPALGALDIPALWANGVPVLGGPFICALGGPDIPALGGPAIPVVLLLLLLVVLIFLLWAVLLFLWSYYSFSWWS
jgi:hypothetical protein